MMCEGGCSSALRPSTSSGNSPHPERERSSQSKDARASVLYLQVASFACTGRAFEIAAQFLTPVRDDAVRRAGSMNRNGGQPVHAFSEPDIRRIEAPRLVPASVRALTGPGLCLELSIALTIGFRQHGLGRRRRRP